MLGVLVAIAAMVMGFSAGSAGAKALHIEALNLGKHTVVPGACALAEIGYSHCNLSLIDTLKGRPLASSSPGAGYAPADLQSAYNLATTAASKGAHGWETVAVIDAYHDPDANSDLATYRAQYGEYPCTIANGCFKQLNQNGVAGSYPSNNMGWGLEISLDLDMVSAICPTCHIMLVEASSNSDANLYAAENTAVKAGATVISNSYGGSESSSDPSNNSYFDHPGIPITVSTGDSGYGVEFPASSPYVTAVGGTTLNRASNARGWTEAAWDDGGSGCSAYETEPTWQVGVIGTGCSNRSVADVSADADPNTGVNVYDSNCNFLSSLLNECFTGWGVVGGTSEASPIAAAIIAMANNSTTYNAGYTYAHRSSLNDVTTGSNGSSCTPTYECNAGVGYDGPTGLGTPNGLGAF